MTDDILPHKRLITLQKGTKTVVDLCAGVRRVIILDHSFSSDGSLLYRVRGNDFTTLVGAQSIVTAPDYEPLCSLECSHPQPHCVQTKR